MRLPTSKAKAAPAAAPVTPEAAAPAAPSGLLRWFRDHGVFAAVEREETRRQNERAAREAALEQRDACLARERHTDPVQAEQARQLRELEPKVRKLREAHHVLVWRNIAVRNDAEAQRRHLEDKVLAPGFLAANPDLARLDVDCADSAFEYRSRHGAGDDPWARESIIRAREQRQALGEETPEELLEAESKAVARLERLARNNKRREALLAVRAEIRRQAIELLDPDRDRIRNLLAAVPAPECECCPHPQLADPAPTLAPDLAELFGGAA
jgi:hypothetical protein